MDTNIIIEKKSGWSIYASMIRAALNKSWGVHRINKEMYDRITKSTVSIRE